MQKQTKLHNNHKMFFQVEEAAERRKAREATKSNGNDSNNNGGNRAENEAGGVITPQYTITNQYGMDMADYSQSISGTPMVCLLHM